MPIHVIRCLGTGLLTRSILLRIVEYAVNNHTYAREMGLPNPGVIQTGISNGNQTAIEYWQAGGKYVEGI
jgi:hypothetical protein